jgi:glycosyltransferase involved in cell wall biosynthesis
MQGETIVCIAPRLWDSLWRESQQIMSRIARHNRVLYFEPGRNVERSVGSELLRNAPNFFRLRTRKIHDNLIIIPTPSSLPVARRYLPRSVLQVTTPVIQKINTMLIARQVHRAMNAFAVQHPILWINSLHPDLPGRFGEKLSCYYNYDETANFIPNARIKDLLQQMDNRLTRRVDIVFATSRAQCQARQPINPNTYFIPNGVDFELFSRALTPLPLPNDLATVPRPIIGFAGWLSYYTDVDLLYRVATAYPECSLVLVGPNDLPESTTRTQLQHLPNVFFLGRKDREVLPNYLRAFDVALMPWILSVGHVRSAYPLKLHEYLAAGRSIVAVALPELQPFSHVLRIAETHDAFLAHIRAALHDDTPQTVAARVAIARENTWDQRVAEIYRILQQHLSIRTTGQHSSDHTSRSMAASA